MKQRRLKVQPRTRVSYGKEASHFVELRLVGTWLQKAGFCAGDYVNVNLEEEKLVITKN